MEKSLSVPTTVFEFDVEKVSLVTLFNPIRKNVEEDS
jgi:hypothetical protein